MVKNLESFASFDELNIFLIFNCLYHSVTFNESKKSKEYFFCFFLAINNVVAPLSSYDVPTKLFS